MLDGGAATALHNYAKQHADLVVVGSHGHHGLRALFGSTSNAVIHGTPCDVLAVHVDQTSAGEPLPYATVLAAVDLGDESFQVMEVANRVALHCGAQLALCNVMHGVRDMLQEDVTDRLMHFADCYGIAEADVFELAGNVADRVHALAGDIGAGLVVVGTHGKHGLQLLTGSTANAILHGAGCDLLAARMH